MSARFQISTASLLAIAVVLGACSLSKVDTGVFMRTAEQDGRAVVDAPMFQGVAPTRVKYADSRIIEEYVLYRSSQGQTELLYSETKPLFKARTVLDFDKLISTSVRMWRFNQGQPLEFSESFTVSNDFATFWIQPYRQTAAGRNCAGFSSRWDIRMDDREFRPSKIMFGFHCAPKGTTFDADAAAAFVKAIQVRGISVPMRVATAYDLNKKTPAPPKDTQVASLVLAQDGGGGGTAGLPEFPLLIARIYNNFDGPACTNC